MLTLARRPASDLFADYQHVARAAARRWPQWRRDPDGVMNAALLGLWRACQRWQPARGAFEPFAVTLCRFAIVDWLRETGTRGRMGRVRTVLGRPLSAAVADLGPHAGSEVEAADLLAYGCRGLTRTRRLLARLVWVEGMTCREAGEVLGRSESWACAQLSRARLLVARRILSPTA